MKNTIIFHFKCDGITNEERENIYHDIKQKMLDFNILVFYEKELDIHILNQYINDIEVIEDGKK